MLLLLASDAHEKTDVCTSHRGVAEQLLEMSHFIASNHLWLHPGQVGGYWERHCFVRKPCGADHQLVQVPKLPLFLPDNLEDFLLGHLGSEPSSISPAKLSRVLRLFFSRVMERAVWVLCDLVPQQSLVPWAVTSEFGSNLFRGSKEGIELLTLASKAAGAANSMAKPLLLQILDHPEFPKPGILWMLACPVARLSGGCNRLSTFQGFQGHVVWLSESAFHFTLEPREAHDMLLITDWLGSWNGTAGLQGDWPTSSLAEELALRRPMLTVEQGIIHHLREMVTTFVGKEVISCEDIKWLLHF